MTRDIDIFIEPTEANANKTIIALKKLGYDVQDLTTETLLRKKILFRQYLLRTDIHPFVAGVSFEEAWKRRKKTRIKGCNVWVPSLDDLLRMKKAAARGKDKLDVDILNEIRNQLNKRNRKKS
jgi:hypothetical protein